MAGAQCVLDVMTQNDFIEILEYDDTLRHYLMVVRGITDESIADEIKDKIDKKIESDSNFIIISRYKDTNRVRYFTKTKDMKEYIQKFIDSGEETEKLTYCIHSQDAYNYIQREYEYLNIDEYGYMTNLLIKEAREKKEEQTDRKALELLNSIL